MPQFRLTKPGDEGEFEGDETPDERFDSNVEKTANKRELERKKKVEAQVDRVKQKRSAPPVPYEPRCSVCNSPYRNFIDAMLARGAANYSDLARKVPGVDGQQLDRKAIANHAKNHLGYVDDAIRKILEDEALSAAQDYETNAKGALTRRGALEVALRKAFEDVTAGRIEVEVKDMLAIITTLEKMDEATNAAAVDQMRMQVEAFIRAIREEIQDEDIHARIVERAKRIIQQQGFTYEPTVDAEAIEPAELPAAD